MGWASFHFDSRSRSRGTRIVFDLCNVVARFHDGGEESRASMRPASDSLEASFLFVFLALKALVQLAVRRVVEVLVAQISQKTLGEAVPHGHASVLIPEVGTSVGETQVANAWNGIAVASDTTFLETPLRSSDHIWCTNQGCQVLGRAADTTGSGVGNDGDSVKIGGLGGHVSPQGVGAGTCCWSRVVVDITDATNGRFSIAHVSLLRGGCTRAVREGVAREIEPVQRRLEFQEIRCVD